jgi:hypothetical protein
MPDRKEPAKRRKRGRTGNPGQIKVSVYFYADELESVQQAAEQNGLGLSGYIALASKARAKSDLTK